METQSRLTPLPAPFRVGAKVRYTGASFAVETTWVRSGWFDIRKGSIGECIAVIPGIEGGVRLGCDWRTSEPDYSLTVHSRSVVRFANGYEAMVDAEMGEYEAV